MKRYLKKVVYCTGNHLEQDVCEEDGILYVADTEQQLRYLKEKGLPIIAWLHGGNRDQNLSGAAYAVENPRELEMDFFERVYRREKGIPWEILETQRCLVREMIPEDGVAFAQIYGEPQMCRYMKDFHGSAEKEEAYIREYQAQYRFYEYGVWSIVLKETGEVIGRVGFSETDTEMLAEMVPETAEVLPQLGYMIGRPWQQQGLAYEVCSAILQYAREELGFEKIALVVDRDNTPSVKLAEKLGFITEKSSCHIFQKVLHLTY